jgi:hypothetical protein
VERGDRPEAVVAAMGKAVFWKDKARIGSMLSLWDAAGLARAAERAGQLERDLLFSRAPDREVLGEALLSIARAARRR